MKRHLGYIKEVRQADLTPGGSMFQDPERVPGVLGCWGYLVLVSRLPTKVE